MQSSPASCNFLSLTSKYSPQHPVLRVQTGSGPTQPPIQWTSGAPSLEVKRPGRATDHSPPSSAEVKECVELYIHSPNTPSWRGAQLKKTQWQLCIYFYPILRHTSTVFFTQCGRPSFTPIENNIVYFNVLKSNQSINQSLKSSRYSISS